MVEELWNDRIIGGVVTNTRRAYSAGFSSLARYSQTMRWEFPYLGNDLLDDLLRIVGWIHYMAVDEGKAASTVDSYVTGAKAQLLLELVISDALGRKGDARHVCVQHAMASVTASVAILLRGGGAVSEIQPIMVCRDGRLLGSREVVRSMRDISTGHGADPKDVVIHSLKHGALSALGAAGASSDDIATAGGHRTIESSVPYLHPDVDQGRHNSEILGRRRRQERGDV
jgi:hypothetical protein